MRVKVAGRSLVWVTAFVVVSGGCAHVRPTQVNLPSQAPIIAIRLSEYHLEVTKDMPAGRVVFEVKNVGLRVHSLMIFMEDVDAPTLDVQLHGSERRAVEPLAQVFPQKPGRIDRFAIDVSSGRRYGLMSTYVDSQGTPDFLKGMNSELVAR